MSRKRRLLLIDSSDSARTILFKELMQRAPELDIVACGSGKEAMSSVKRFEFEIITTGINLPDTDGYQLIEEIRKTPKNKKPCRGRLCLHPQGPLPGRPARRRGRCRCPWCRNR